MQSRGDGGSNKGVCVSCVNACLFNDFRATYTVLVVHLNLALGW